MKVVRENTGLKMYPFHFLNQNGWTWNYLIYLAWKKLGSLCLVLSQFKKITKDKGSCPNIIRYKKPISKETI